MNELLVLGVYISAYFVFIKILGTQGLNNSIVASQGPEMLLLVNGVRILCGMAFIRLTIVTFWSLNQVDGLAIGAHVLLIFAPVVILYSILRRLMKL